MRSTGAKSQDPTLFVVDSLASPTPKPDEDSEFWMIGGSGRTWLDLFAIFVPDGCWWRTSQESLLPDSEKSLETWPDSGTTVSGRAYRRPRWVRHISGGESSLWPTPVRLDSGRTPESYREMKLAMPGGPRYTVTSLSVAVKLWPTPEASDASGGRMASEVGGIRPSGSKRAISLATAANSTIWPTPTAEDSQASGMGTGITLTDAAVRGRSRTGQKWPTPTARDHKDGSFCPNVPVNGLLGRAVWATPTARLGNGRGAQAKRFTDPSQHYDLDDQVLSVAVAENGGASPGGSLNPAWVEWLMGFPAGWTDLEL